MTKYRKKPVVVEAYQWWEIDKYEVKSSESLDDVRRYECTNEPVTKLCPHCGYIMHDHGFIDTLEGGHIVCPGDYIITGVKGEKYPCKPDIFEQTYSLAGDVLGMKCRLCGKPCTAISISDSAGAAHAASSCCRAGIEQETTQPDTKMDMIKMMNK
jgi:hypothetical protein